MTASGTAASVFSPARPAPLAAALQTASRAARHPSALLHLLLTFGTAGILFISIVDSSFVPLPVPGITDIMLIVFAARHVNLVLLVAAATVGSFLGGLFSYQVGQSGGMAFLEKHVSPRIFERVCGWMEHHAILAVALPAILPPPMPLSPFVLAAGALKMSRRKFLIAFTLSRGVRHAAAAALGVWFGPQVLHLWNAFSRKWATPILIAIWTVITVSVAVAFYKLWKTSREMRGPGTQHPATSN
ncbi:MAG TPA: VTT domain-containing protein [Acidobacteriaceae bacterium]|nr:VTT domain-containing protein [Acidobacteriaceae bacterium]